MSGVETITADLVWTGGRFERGVSVTIEDGRIASVERDGVTSVTRTLGNRALLPGFVNAHSHAFQRGLRGLGETFPAGAGSFWSWREAMYGLVASLDRSSFRELTLRAFREMLSAGITTVGEFHYLHHDRAGDGSSTGAFELDEVVLECAAEAGIRLVLLEVYYNRGGFDQPLSAAQQRFAVNSVDDYWRAVDRLESLVDGTEARVGTVAHSVRAATLDDIASLHEESVRRGHVFHMHLEEQRKEIEECVAHHGRRPLALLLDRLAIDERFTAVHATHSLPDDLEEFFSRGGNACIAPLTEGNLGDGIPASDTLRRHSGKLSLGSDSNARISMIEEMRWLEYVHRLAGERRGVFADGDGRLADVLLSIATEGGARSLGIEAGAIEPGRLADMIAIDLGHPLLEGWSDESIPGAIVFGAHDGVIAEVCVGGKWRPA